MQTLVPSRLRKSKFYLPWISKHVRKQMKSRDKLYVRAIKSKSPQDLKRFKDARSKVKHNIRQNHRTYISEFVAASLNDSPKSFWSYIGAIHREKLAFLLLEKVMVYQQHPTVQKPMC